MTVITKSLVYNLDRGIGLFQRLGVNGYIDLGNLKAVSFTKTVEVIEHKSTRKGLAVIDDLTNKSIKAEGSFEIDSQEIDVMSLFTMSDTVDNVAQASGSTTDVAHTVPHDLIIPIRDSSGDHLFNISGTITVKHTSGSPTYTIGTDYEIDSTLGLLKVLSTGTIANGESVKISVGTVPALAMSELKAGTKAQLQGDFLFLGQPAKGLIKDFRARVNLTPDGEFPMISEDYPSYKLKFSCIDLLAGNGLYQLRTRGVQT